MVSSAHTSLRPSKTEIDLSISMIDSIETIIMQFGSAGEMQYFNLAADTFLNENLLPETITYNAFIKFACDRSLELKDQTDLLESFYIENSTNAPIFQDVISMKSGKGYLLKVYPHELAGSVVTLTDISLLIKKK